MSMSSVIYSYACVIFYHKKTCKFSLSFFHSLLVFPQVYFLEQQNKMLETKWNLLQEQTSHQSSIDIMFESYIANLRRQLDGMGNEKLRLQSGLQDMTSRVEDFKIK